MPKTEADWKEKLIREGFSNIQTIIDQPGKNYPPHSHKTTNPHIILDGTIELTLGYAVHHLRAGDRLDVPARVLHSALVGPDGCTFIVGEK